MPGSKSATNRALVLAALADGVTVLDGAVLCDDSERMIDSLRRLGFEVEIDEYHSDRGPEGPRHSTNGRRVEGEAVTSDDGGRTGTVTITVAGLGGRIPANDARLEVGNAGTAARFLTALAALGEGRFVVDGDLRMRERPIEDLVQALQSLGVAVQSTHGCPPVIIGARGLRGGRATVRGTASSQFLSALLLVAPCADAPIEIEVSDRLTSRPYVEMTRRMMASFGIQVVRDGDRGFRVPTGRYAAQPSYPIEPDASSASYFFAAAAIVGGQVRVEGLSMASTQGDVGFVQLLASMGCRVTVDDTWIGVTGGAPLEGVRVDLGDTPDLAPTLAVVAPFARTPTTISGIASARRKECDRVAAVCTELRRLGVTVVEHADGMTIGPCPAIRPAVVHTYDDHRMAMAFSLIGLRAPGVVIENPGCVSKTFPRYFDALEELRGR